MIGDNDLATVKDTVGSGGTDTLIGVERVQFDDLLIALDGTNAAPVLTAGDTIAYNEGDAAAAIDTTITITDPDSTNVAGATVSIKANFDAAGDVLGFTNQNGITGSYNAGTGVLTLTGNTSNANYQTALRSVTYQTTSEDPLGADRTISFQIEDGSAATADSNIATSTVQVTTVNDAPAVTAGATLAFTEGAGAGVVDATVTVTDVDSDNISGATVAITTGFVAGGEDVLGFIDQNGITGSYSTVTGVLTLAGTTTLGNYQAALQSVTDINTSSNPSTTTRAIEFQVTDAGDDQDDAVGEASNVATSTVTIAAANDAPVLAGGDEVSFTKGDAPAAFNTLLTITDADSANLVGATITISDGFDQGNDVLGFTNQNGITGSYNATTGVLTLSGTATVANYETAIKSVTYSISGDDPTSDTRTVSVQVDDGAGANNLSNVLESGVFVTTDNDAPVISDAGSTLDYTEGDGAVVIDGTLTITDPDSSDISSATVSITTGFVAGGEDVLGFVDQNGITGSYSTTTGVLMLSGTATVAQYEAALESVTYTNTSLSPDETARTIEFQVTDDGDDLDDATQEPSNVATSTVTVTDIPGVDPVDLDDVANGTGGFRMFGENADDNAGDSVSGAGDVNGDGFEDVIIGARFNDDAGDMRTGAAYVVFGAAGGITDVNLDDIAAGTGGFAIIGEASYDFAGDAVAGAGDVNGDGIDDVIVGAARHDAGGFYAGAAYVVYGAASGLTTINLADVAAGTGGFKITGEIASGNAGYAVASAGDVNGDGFGDVIVGSTNANAVYVVYGADGGLTSIDLVDVAAGTGGFKIVTEVNGDQAGSSVSSAGDVNGDGIDDLIVGARANDEGGYSAGAAYVVFGGSGGLTTIELADVALGTGGFKIIAQAGGDRTGMSVSSAGDIDGDGFADLIVGASRNDAGGYDAGAAYVVYGASGDLSAVDLDVIAAGTGGFKLVARTPKISPAFRSPRPATSTAMASTT